MRVETRSKTRPVVVLMDRSTVPQTPCGWVHHCPRDTNEMTIMCDTCPADQVFDDMTHEEAIKWWKKAKLKEIQG